MSNKTLAQKLAIKPGASLYLSDEGTLALIEPLPEGVQVVGDPSGATAAIYFASGEAALRELLAANEDHLAVTNPTWIAYPKGNKADINRDSLWPIVAEYGLRPNGQVAIDEVWSALRFRPPKPGEAPFTGGKS